MKILRFVLPAWAALLTGCASTGTTGTIPLEVGQQVRIHTEAAPEEPLEGRIVGLHGAGQLELEIDSSSIDNRYGAKRLEVRLDDLKSLAVRSPRRHAQTGAVIGLGAGLAFFAVLGASDPGGGSISGGWAIVPVFLAAGAALIGTLVGLLFQSYEWVDQPIPPLIAPPAHE